MNRSPAAAAVKVEALGACWKTLTGDDRAYNGIQATGHWISEVHVTGFIPAFFASANLCECRTIT